MGNATLRPGVNPGATREEARLRGAHGCWAERPRPANAGLAKGSPGVHPGAVVERARMHRRVRWAVVALRGRGASACLPCLRARSPHRPSGRVRMSLPSTGEIVRIRSRQFLVEDVHPEAGAQTLVSLSCVDDDAQGDRLRVLWEREPDAKVLRSTAWDVVSRKGFDEPRRMAAYLHAQAGGTASPPPTRGSSRPRTAPASRSSPTSSSPSARRCGCPASTCSSPTTSGSARPSRPA